MICLSFRYTSQKKAYYETERKKPVYEFTLSNAEIKKKNKIF